jgi:hypothetical protein
VSGHEILQFFNRLGFADTFTSVVKIRTDGHELSRCAGTLWLASLALGSQAGTIYDIDVIYAWDRQVFRRNLVDYNLAEAARLSWKRSGSWTREKIVLYLCHSAMALRSEITWQTLPGRSVIGRHWRAVHHGYLDEGVAHPFHVPAEARVRGASEISAECSTARNGSSASSSSALKTQQELEGGLRVNGRRRPGTESKPLVSVVTVVLQGARHLEQAIQSVINQPCPLLEYLIIDGGSTDGTVDIIRQYEDQIDYWVSEPDRGIYAAMNKGWELSRGSYIYYLGADDVLLQVPDQQLSNALANNEEIVVGHVYLDNGRLNRGAFGRSLLLNNTVPHQGQFVKTTVCAGAPFDEKYRYFGDFDFHQRMFLQKKKAGIIDTPIAIYRLGSTNKAGFREFFQITRKNFGIFAMLASYVFLKMRGFVFRVRGWT